MKSEAYNLGWHSTMKNLRILSNNPLEQQFYMENVHYRANVLLINIMEGNEKDYAEGILAAINLFEKTGVLPLG